MKSRIIKAKEASDLNLDGFPLLKNKETSHILITGTTGSGKTNCFHTLLPQIRGRPNRAVVVDLTGDFVSRYYRPNHDILLNPFDERSAIWNPWGECLEPPHYDALAAAIVAESPSAEPFWEKASKTLLSTALHKLALQGERDVTKLYQLLVCDDVGEFSTFFRNTDPSTTTWISKVLGEAEVTENIENLSYGANTMRDGVSLAQQTRTKPLVLPTEIGSLKDCEAYFKLPGAYPVTHITMHVKFAS